MSMKEKLRKTPFLFSALSFVKYNIYLPVKRGHVAYYIKWSVSVKSKEIKKLSSWGFEDIKPFAPFTWRIGREKDRAYRRYYTATLNGTKCFIKIGKNDSTVKNEALVCAKLKGQKIRFMAEPLAVDMEFSANTVMLANEFIENMRSIGTVAEFEDFKRVCADFIKVLEELKKQELVHADIHKGNMMLTTEKKLILLDFGISIMNKTQKQVDYRSRPGTFYRNSADGKKRIYDDAYSFVKMFETLGLPRNWKQAEEFKSIEKMIDGYCVEVDL